MLEKALKLLTIEGAVAKEKSVYHRTLNPWQPNYERSQAVTQVRRQELEKMRQYVHTKECLMAFLALGEKRTIPEHRLNQEGRALCIYGDAGWGPRVALGKYRDQHFSDELITTAAQLIQREWRPDPFPRCVAAVPSLRARALVQDFAERLAARLGLAFAPVVVKTQKTQPQKAMANSAQQVANIINAFAITGKVPEGPCLLVDDIFDSRTLTVVGYLIAEHGSGPVYPFTLAKASDRKSLN